MYVFLLHINRRSSFIVRHPSRIALMMLPSPAPRVVPHPAARRNRGVVWRGPSAFAKPFAKPFRKALSPSPFGQPVRKSRHADVYNNNNYIYMSRRI